MLIIKIDNVLAKPWQFIGALINWLTGRDNFFAARTLVAIGYFLIVLAGAIGGAGSSLGDGVFLGVGFFPLYSYIWALTFKVQNENQCHGNALSRLDQHIMHLRLTWQLLAVIAGIAHFQLIAACSMLGATGAFYLITQDRPRRDHALKRAWVKLKARVKVPSVAKPVPTPA